MLNASELNIYQPLWYTQKILAMFELLVRKECKFAVAKKCSWDWIALFKQIPVNWRDPSRTLFRTFFSKRNALFAEFSHCNKSRQCLHNWCQQRCICLHNWCRHPKHVEKKLESASFFAEIISIAKTCKTSEFMYMLPIYVMSVCVFLSFLCARHTTITEP